MSWQWITTDAALRSLIDALADEPFVAVDTEFRRRDTYYPQIALVQLATPDGCWLIDPLELTVTEPLRQFLINDSIVKVLHSASEDLEVFERWLGVLPRPLCDTQRAAAMLGLGFGLSYRALIEQQLGIEVAKDETQSDWLARPLSPAQCEYAAQDVTYLAQCWQILRDRAQARGVLDWILEEGAATSTGGRGPLAKFKSAWKLKPGQLAALLTLIDWREAEARTRDKPRSWILNDKVLAELASRLPENMPQLADIKGFPSGLLRRQGKRILELIGEAREKGPSPDQLPPPKPATADVKLLAKALSPTLQQIADEQNMNVEILMPNRELELIAREAMGEPVAVPAHWQGWRGALAIAPLRRQAAELVGVSA